MSKGHRAVRHPSAAGGPEGPSFTTFPAEEPPSSLRFPRGSRGGWAGPPAPAAQGSQTDSADSGHGG